MTSNTLVAVVAIAVLIFWAVGAHNRLVRLRNTIANAFGQIDVLLKRRHDLIPNLVDAAKTCIDQDTEALEAVTTARNAAQSALTVARGRPVNALAVTNLAAAEQTLARSLASLFALSDCNPKLQADRSVQGLREELISIENKVAFARQTFNDAVLDYNSAQGQFPAVMLAKLFSFAPSAMLQASESAGARAAA